MKGESDVMEKDVLTRVEAILKSTTSTSDIFTSTSLVTSGIIDSLALVMIVSELSDEFGVEIPVECLTPDNFDSAGAIARMIIRLTNQTKIQ